MSGFCMTPSPGSHRWCHDHLVDRGAGVCDCPCHQHPDRFDDGHTIGDTLTETWTADGADSHDDQAAAG